MAAKWGTNYGNWSSMSVYATEAAAPVRFGDLEHNTVPPDVAETMLRAYRKRHPREFGDLYMEHMLGVDTVRKRAQNGAGG